MQNDFRSAGVFGNAGAVDPRPAGEFEAFISNITRNAEAAPSMEENPPPDAFRPIKKFFEGVDLGIALEKMGLSSPQSGRQHDFGGGDLSKAIGSTVESRKKESVRSYLKRAAADGENFEELISKVAATSPSTAAMMRE